MTVKDVRYRLVNCLLLNLGGQCVRVCAHVHMCVYVWRTYNACVYVCGDRVYIQCYLYNIAVNVQNTMNVSIYLLWIQR